MKKFLLTSLLVMIPCVAVCETTEQNWHAYLGANMGINASDVTVKGEDFFDFGGVFNFELGARYKQRYRLALNYQSRAEVSELFQILFGHVISITNDAIRINGYYDYVSLKHFAMYVGAGLGGDRYDYTITNRADDSKKSKHGITFTGGATTGLSFSFWHIAIDLGFSFDYIAEPRIYSYGPNLGLRYNF
ncbi:MAG: outer membrane beta-barrel protein [Alphaproteobacteria bacterium]|nr:outer membrane beta-barrel protein [Alphaproteobacteria bacterium]